MFVALFGDAFLRLIAQAAVGTHAEPNGPARLRNGDNADGIVEEQLNSSLAETLHQLSVSAQL